MNPELLQKYLAGELTATEAAELKRQLQSDPAARRQFARGVMDEGLFVEAAGMVAVELAKPQRDHDRRPAGWWRRPWKVSAPLAAAACLAFVAGGLWFLLRPAAPGLQLAAVAGKCSVFRVQGSGGESASSAAGGVPAVVGMALRPGDRVAVNAGGTATLKYDGEATTLDLHSATATFRAEKGAKRVRLDSGLLVCTAAPQRQAFQLETPHAVAEVVGTRFWLAADTAQTTLAVQEGKVALRQQQQRLDVNAGEMAVADAAGLRKLSPADAWLRDLLVRAETGAWEALDFQQGTIVGDPGVWRLDRRGAPVVRRIWQTDSRATSTVLFEAAKWKRGVVVGRVMMLSEGDLPAALAVPEPASKAVWTKVARGLDIAGVPNGAYLAIYRQDFRENLKDSLAVVRGLDAAADPHGVWHRFAVYFDMAATGGVDAVWITWPADRAGLPSAAGWGSCRFADLSGQAVGIGLMTKGVPALWEGVKLVPLGPDLPPPPGGAEK